MEEKESKEVFQNRKIAVKEERNLVNLRQDFAAGNKTVGRDFRGESFRGFESVPSAATAEVPQEKKFSGLQSKVNPKVSASILDRLTEYGMYLLIFLMPLFILPFSVEVYEFNKSFLLAFGSVLLFFIWILDSIFVKKKIQFSKSLLTISFSVFLLVILLSSYFSIDVASSFWGYGGNFSDSFVFYLGLFVFYTVFLGVSAVKGADRVISKSIGALTLSALLVSATALPYYFGYTYLPGFGGVLAGLNFASGYYHAFAIYLLVMLFIVFYDFSSFGKFSRARKALDVLAAVLILVNLFLIDWPMVYLIIFILCTALVVFGGTLKKENFSRRSESAALLMMIFSSVLFMSSVNLSEIMLGRISVGNSSSVSSIVKGAFNIKMENAATSVQNGFGSKEAVSIARSGLSDRPILGSGLGTYYYDFSKYKSVDFNYGQNWKMGFNKAYNEMLEKVSTIGILGVLSYLFLVAVALFLIAKNVKAKKNSEFFLAAFLSLLIFQFLFFETAIIKFLFVLLLAIASASRIVDAEAGSDALKKIRKEMAILDIDNQKISGGAVSFFGVIAVLLCSTSLVLGIQVFRAEAKYVAAINSANPAGLDPDALSEITKLNPYKGDYAAGLSRIYLARIYLLANSGKNDQETVNKVAVEVNNALSYAKKSVEVSPNDLLLWENYSYIYKSVNDLGMEGGNDWAIKGYESAINLCPNDPMLRTELSKMYLTKYQTDKSDADKKNDLRNAKTQLEKAQELKSDYVDAALELAIVYSYEGDDNKTLQQVDLTSKMGGLDIPSAVEIGRIYYNLGEKDKAKGALLQVVADNVDPKNADALYILGAIYKEEKNYSEALNAFRTIEKSNPDNKGLKKSISDVESLMKGGTANDASNASSGNDAEENTSESGTVEPDVNAEQN
ncbi:MAG: tetratricopeptide repeat protein [Patescibacteria group bacterium]